MHVANDWASCARGRMHAYAYEVEDACICGPLAPEGEENSRDTSFYVIGDCAQVEVKHTVQRSAYCLTNQEHQEDPEQGDCSSSARDELQPGEQPGAAAATCAREKARRGAHAQGEWVPLDPDDVGFVVGVPALTDLSGVSLALSLPCECLVSVRA